MHPTGNANVRATLQALHETGLLNKFYTCIACFSGNIFEKLSKIKGLSEFNRRRFPEELKPYTTSVPFRELGRLLAMKLKINSWVRHEKGWLSVDAVYQALDLHVSEKIRQSAQGDLDGIYAYEDGAAYSFKAAKEKGIPAFYDLPTGYWRTKIEIINAQRSAYPEWQSTITALMDSKEKLDRKDREIALADRIFVASKFTADSLQLYPGKLPEVHIVPYGFPEVDDAIEIKDIVAGKPLKLLFVGSLSQQKGLANLFEAAEYLRNKVELTIVGRKANNDCDALNKGLSKYNWIPSLPHQEILTLMRGADLLVFPTIFDGFGLVITESMSQGTPVITTYNCAGPDLIEHGKNGWLFNAGSTPELITLIEELYREPQAITNAAKNAMETARKRPWSKFRQELAGYIQND